MLIPPAPCPLKICQTCPHWSYSHKGLCACLDQGVGKFWFCEDWADPREDLEGGPAAERVPGTAQEET